jgi:hypothetical protein
MKNDCDKCPILNYGNCPLLDMAYDIKGWEGFEKCEMKNKITLVVESTKKDMVTWAGRKAAAKARGEKI